ncbi:MAG TPA: type II toxin-antitoxin system HicB family antitoxin [Polyangia bacterium]
MSKPNYRATVTFDSDRKVFSARAPELEHCSGEGATRAEALAKLEEEIDAQLANMLSHGSTPPRAIDEETFSGEIAAKVSKLLHRELAYQARSEGIDLDHLVGELLAAAMESRKQHRGVRSGNSRPREDQQPHDNVGNRFDGGGRQRGFGGRGNNAHLLDDRANFIEYVRGLEQQGGAPRHGGHGGPSGGGGGRGRRGRGGGGGGGGGGRGGNPNHGGPNRGMHGGMQGGPRPQQHHAGSGNGNFGGGSNGNQPHGGGEPGGGHHGDSHAAAPTSAAPTSHDPDSSGNL